MAQPSLSKLKEHPDVIAAILCGIFVLLGWFFLHFNLIGLALLILPVAYVIGGYESAREGLTTLFVEKQLDVDSLMIVAALGAAGLGLWRQEYYLIIDGVVLITLCFDGSNYADAAIPAIGQLESRVLQIAAAIEALFRTSNWESNCSSCPATTATITNSK